MSPTLGIFDRQSSDTIGIHYGRRAHGDHQRLYASPTAVTASQNGFALAGEWCSAAAFLGFTGLRRCTAWYGAHSMPRTDV